MLTLKQAGDWLETTNAANQGIDSETMDQVFCERYNIDPGTWEAIMQSGILTAIMVLTASGSFGEAVDVVVRSMFNLGYEMGVAFGRNEEQTA